jgi:beta-aspartyl-peptidase (threonine type)
MEKNKIAIVVHGGAGPDSSFIRSNKESYRDALEEAVNTGYRVLEEGGKAIDSVQAAVQYLEDSPLFNAGRGSALNAKGEVEMCASIMDGRNLKSGAVALVRNIRNPVVLARAVMDHSPHVFMGCSGATEFARKMNIAMEQHDYFIVQHQLDSFRQMAKEARQNPEMAIKGHGTVGAVACDANGDVAASTSTGGIEYSHQGRIGDSASVGAGVYANNGTCAASATGQGEAIIRHVLCHQLHSLIEFNQMPVHEAAALLIYQKLKDENDDMGLIAVDSKGTIAFSFNSERMHRAWRTSDGEIGSAIYPD